MQKIYPLQTGGGKGNMGMFIERKREVCAAGMPSAQFSESVARCLTHYSLQDEVDSLIGDSLKPKAEPIKLPPLRKPRKKDLRHAGPFTEVRNNITYSMSETKDPRNATKFETLVQDFQETIYTSYWKKRVGAVPDQTPNLPKQFDFFNTTLGKKTPYDGSLYDIILPRDTVPDKRTAAKQTAFQTDHKYCRESYYPNYIYGKKSNPDHHGKWMKLCLVDDRVPLGLTNTVHSAQLVNFNNSVRAPMGKVLAPNHNISNVPPDYSFGKLKPPDNISECLTYCKTNPDRDLMNKCLKHLNTLRRSLRSRFDKNFFINIYLKIKYLDKSKTGWLPKQYVYDFCHQRHVTFDHLLLEPLLTVFNAFDGTQINYRIFIDTINYTIPTQNLPKIWDVPVECIAYSTTYSEMFKPDQKRDKSLRAGVPSGRYIDLDYPITPDGCCKAVRSYLPEESDARSCLNPSVFTLLNVSHRDMYANRSPEVIRKVFEAVGEKFTDEKFESVLNMAKKKHSEEWVSFESFRQALDMFHKE